MKTARLPDQAGDLRRRLADPRRLCEQLGIADGAKPQGGGALTISCPWHAERTPSCSVRVAGDGTISVKCFGCGMTADALGLIAQVNGLSTQTEFEKVLQIAADLAGTSLDDAAPPPPARPRPAPAPARDYPPRDEVSALWDAAVPVVDDVEVAGWLRSRELDPAVVADRDLARALPIGTELSRWARTRLGTWTETGYRCLVPMFDEVGRLRSVRARRIVVRDDDSPKALPPTGHRVSGLIMADGLARQILERGGRPHFWPARADLVIVVAEGEPDFLLWSCSNAEGYLTAPATLGIVAGSWTPEIAARIPDRAIVDIWSHFDAAGEKYSEQIVGTLKGRVTLRRGLPE